LADLIALGRPLISDPDLIEKWKNGKFKEVKSCGYCLQGCLHRVKSGESIGCNLNPEIGKPALARTDNPLKVLVAGGGPAGMSAAWYLEQRGHNVTLVEKESMLGGQFNLVWQAPGKEKMQDGLDNLVYNVMSSAVTVIAGKMAGKDMVKEMRPDLLVWAVGATQNIPDIKGLENQHHMTSLEYFKGVKPVKDSRVLVIGAGRTGLEIAEKLGSEGFEVIATKRTDPIGSMMEMITKKLTLMRIEQIPNITLMPHTTVLSFGVDKVELETDVEKIELEPFDTVILASGMLSAPGPDAGIQNEVAAIETIGDAKNVMDIYTAVHAGYELALKY
jgi:NADPH-dependent 2,4-dienoyl-CoA reductase/sulfur reductase-like enzyme